ncbi:type II toxin-antitoxin system VapC family toxin [Micromonospora sp. NPDC002389]|uniref:type II toxin-antitoxin system VapC family toxin n=1 Tax=Micromonospora sp. NPDC002389 TaxID=3154272 RepID=UPI0033314F7F
MKYTVVDTDAFSEIWQSPSDQLLERLIGSTPVLSFATVAELHFGAAKAGWGERRVLALEEAIRRYLVAPYDPDLARLWGRLKSQAQKSGHALGHATQTNDLWVCATAIYHNAPLLTLNRRHFESFPGLVLA